MENFAEVPEEEGNLSHTYFVNRLALEDFFEQVSDVEGRCKKKLSTMSALL